MRGSRIPSGKRIINNVSFPPLNPLDFSEANANNLMFLWDSMGTGEFLEDASILDRHFSRLMAREQVVPNLTLSVNAGVAWFSQNTFVTFAGGSSAAFPAPAVNPRIDLLTLRNDNTLRVISGVEAVSPVAPSIPSTDVGLAQVFNVVGQTTIRDNDTQVGGQGFIQYDLRPFIQNTIGANAMPKIGLIAKVQATNATNVAADVVNFTGAGKLLGINIRNLTSGGQQAQGVIQVIIDGVTFSVTSAVAGGTTDNNVIILTGDSTTMLSSLNVVATFTEFADGLSFKNSLQITHRSGNGLGGTVRTSVAYERE